MSDRSGRDRSKDMVRRWLPLALIAAMLGNGCAGPGEPVESERGDDYNSRKRNPPPSGPAIYILTIMLKNC